MEILQHIGAEFYIRKNQTCLTEDDEWSWYRLLCHVSVAVEAGIWLNVMLYMQDIDIVPNS